MSARTLAWSELTGPHLSRHLADWQAEKDWAKFRPGPEPTWEEVREAWMAGGGEHRRDVATPEGVLGTNCACESVYAAAEAAIRAESAYVHLCAMCHGSIKVLTCAPDDNSGANCTCQWTCEARNKLIDASNTTCRQMNDYTVPPCPPMWSDEYVPLFGSTPPWVGTGEQLCGLKEESWDDCPAPDSSGLKPPAKATNVHAFVQSYWAVTPIARLDEICNWKSDVIISILEQTYGLLLANADLVRYQLCATFEATDDADFMTLGTQDITPVITAMCAWLAGRGTTPVLIAEPGSEPALAACGTVMDGGRKGDDAQTTGERIHLYIGRLGETTLDPTDHTTILARALAVDPTGSGVGTHEMCELMALIAHEMLHVCGFRHDDGELRSRDDKSYDFQRDLNAGLAKRYGV